MRESRIYINAPLTSGDTVTLPSDSSHYLAQVLRAKSGDLLRPFNDKDGEFLATIVKADRKQTIITVGQLVLPASSPQFPIHLGLGLSRGDRMDFAIQKATELGVTSITPLFTEFSEVKFKQADRRDKKLAHWQKIAISASEQSGRISIPTVFPPGSVEEWASSVNSELQLVLDPEGDTGFQQLNQGESCDLLIGPEGGFSDSELELAKTKGFTPVKMGQRVLRTETAPVAALAILQYKFGDIT